MTTTPDSSTPRSSPVLLSQGCLDALHHLKEKRDVNTTVLRLEDDTLTAETEANWTHDELLLALPPAEPRLVVHELSFATPTGARRHELLLILWTPPHAAAQEEAYTAAYTTLKDTLTDIRVHLIARHHDQLTHPRLVRLAG
ncbi:hypothetical protein EF912_36855 [Streptomyces sp. WAC07061]|uniref:hypothetical protein n=1 Tax=Streptomyces sp. WAC07061 TaxID=2487410 RepID=UPI000F79135F|nr:hypothetical protein [Streptomyces sp. WAC07061]RSS34387.1 hypothetical protein EF912_36855 [Streptomyces sp. WAC07061]